MQLFHDINDYLYQQNYPSHPEILHILQYVPDSKVHGAHMGPTWGRQDPGEPHVGPINFAIWGEAVLDDLDSSAVKERAMNLSASSMANHKIITFFDVSIFLIIDSFHMEDKDI